MGTKINNIVIKFTKKELPRIKGDPDYEAINGTEQAMYGNAATLETTLGLGAHGYIGLIIMDALYETITSMAYASPLYTGLTATVPVVVRGGVNIRMVTILVIS